MTDRNRQISGYVTSGTNLVDTKCRCVLSPILFLRFTRNKAEMDP
jgi:hypothetical protein